MFTLITDRSKFFRVKRGLSVSDIEKTFNIPLSEVFEGAVIEIGSKYEVYTAVPGDTYKGIAEKFGVDAETLRKINSDRPVYPTRRLYIPCKFRGVSI